MIRASLKDSLAFLAPKGDSDDEKPKKIISPVRIPTYDSDDVIQIESLLRVDSDEEKKESKKVLKKRGRKKKVPEPEPEPEPEEDNLSEEVVSPEEDNLSEEVVSPEPELSPEEDNLSEEVVSPEEDNLSEEVVSPEEDNLSEEVVSPEPELSPEEDNLSEEVVSPEPELSPEEEISSSDFGEDDSDHEVELKTSKLTSLTPKRFKVKFPKSPKKHRDTLEIKKKLVSLRYNIIKFIFNEEDSSINYVICFDPNGELVFVDVEDEKVKVFDEEKILRINYKDDSLTMSPSFMEGIRNKLTFDVYGVIFYDGIDYCIMKRNDEGTIISDNYTTLEETVKERSSIPYCYSIVKYSTLVADPLEAIKSTKSSYQIIQNQQIKSTKFTIEHLMNITKSLTEKIYQFDRKYKEVTKDIIDDWSQLSSYASNFYSSFHKGELDKSDKESFDQVSINMFVRFQIFNEQVEEVDTLHHVVDKINGSIYALENIITNLHNKNEKLKNKMITVDEMDQYI